MSVSRTLGILAILGALLGVWLLVTGSVSQAANSSPVEKSVDSGEPIELLRSDEDGIVFAVELSGFEVEQGLFNGVAYDVVSIPGFASGSEAGSPQVPGRRILLGIPLGADYDLRVSAEEPARISGPYRLLPGPTPILELDPDSNLDPGARAQGTASWEYVEDEQAYSADVFSPQAIAKIAGTGFIRDQRYIAVQVNPVQYNPVSRELILHDRFTVEIDFAYERGLDLGSRQSDASFEPVLSTSLQNYESAASWRGKQSQAILPASLAETALDAGLPAFKIMVNEDGIYQVTAADLETAGIPVSAIPTTTYKLSYRGREVPIRVFEAADESLESFWFYGEQSRTKYTDTNVYWLTYDPEPLPGAEPGRRMPSRSVPPVPMPPVEISTSYSTTVRLEEDLRYRSYMPWAGNLDSDPWDHWFWDYTYYYWPDPGYQYNKPVLAFPTQISVLSTEPYSAMLSSSVSGLTSSLVDNPDHCVDFYVNGEGIGRHTWDGRYSEEVVSFAFPSSHLLEGTNTVKVQVCETETLFDITFYDWFELDVRRRYQAEDDSLAFDVAETGWQYRLDGFSTDVVEIFDVSGTYTVSHLIDAGVTLSDSSYIAAFYDEAAEQGTRYLALTHSQLKSPTAIEEYSPSNLADPANHADYVVITPKEFLADVQPLRAHREAQGLAVQVVELEPIFDEFNYGIYSPEAIRDFLAYAYHNWSGDAPSYVLLVGDGTYDYRGNLSDGNPNLLPPYLAWVDPWIGETAADNRYVTVAGDDPFPDMHIGRLPAETTAHLTTMVAKIIAYETNPPSRDWTEHVLFVTDDPDSAGNFYAYSDDLINNYLPEPYVPIKAYYGSTCLTGELCKQVILDTLNTTGALLVNYIGHGGVMQWTGTEGVWRVDDLFGLVDTDRLPVMLPMTCSEGAFHQVEWDVLAESTVRIDGRGAVASWSATGLGVADGHDYLNKGFLQAVLYDGVRELGVAADAGKARLAATGYFTDLLETYHLFGDPALRLNSLDVVDVAVGQAIDAPEGLFPRNVVTLTLPFTNAGPDVAAGVVLTELLPSVLVTPTVVYSSPEVLVLREGLTLAWTIDDLLPGAAGKIVLEATVDPQFPSDSEVSFFNEARVSVQTHDLVPENNVARIGVNLRPVYLPLVLKGF